MKNILCYGDSLSWGIIPGTRNRLSFERRWPGVLQNKLGTGFRVIEESINGRTTSWEDPVRPNRNGLKLLPPILESHSPIDLVILALGTNDLQAIYNASARDSAQGVSALIRIIQSLKTEPLYIPPKALIVVPPNIINPKGLMEKKFAGATEKSRDISSSYLAIAKESGVAIFDSSKYISASEIDGIHLDESNHLELGLLLAPIVNEITQSET